MLIIDTIELNKTAITEAVTDALNEYERMGLSGKLQNGMHENLVIYHERDHAEIYLHTSASYAISQAEFNGVENHPITFYSQVTYWDINPLNFYWVEDENGDYATPSLSDKIEYLCAESEGFEDKIKDGWVRFKLDGIADGVDIDNSYRAKEIAESICTEWNI